MQRPHGRSQTPEKSLRILAVGKRPARVKLRSDLSQAELQQPLIGAFPTEPRGKVRPLVVQQQFRSRFVQRISETDIAHRRLVQRPLVRILRALYHELPDPEFGGKSRELFRARIGVPPYQMDGDDLPSMRAKLAQMSAKPFGRPEDVLPSLYRLRRQAGLELREAQRAQFAQGRQGIPAVLEHAVCIDAVFHTEPPVSPSASVPRRHAYRRAVSNNPASAAP